MQGDQVEDDQSPVEGEGCAEAIWAITFEPPISFVHLVTMPRVLYEWCPVRERSSRLGRGWQCCETTRWEKEWRGSLVRESVSGGRSVFDAMGLSAAVGNGEVGERVVREDVVGFSYFCRCFGNVLWSMAVVLIPLALVGASFRLEIGKTTDALNIASWAYIALTVPTDTALIVMGTRLLASAVYWEELGRVIATAASGCREDKVHILALVAGRLRVLSSIVLCLALLYSSTFVFAAAESSTWWEPVESVGWLADTVALPITLQALYISATVIRSAADGLGRSHQDHSILRRWSRVRLAAASVADRVHPVLTVFTTRLVIAPILSAAQALVIISPTTTSLFILNILLIWMVLAPLALASHATTTLIDSLGLHHPQLAHKQAPTLTALAHTGTHLGSFFIGPVRLTPELLLQAIGIAFSIFGILIRFGTLE